MVSSHAIANHRWSIHLYKCAKSTLGEKWCRFCEEKQLKVRQSKLHPNCSNLVVMKIAPKQTHISGCYRRLKAVDEIISSSDIAGAVAKARQDEKKWPYLRNDVR